MAIRSKVGVVVADVERGMVKTIILGKVAENESPNKSEQPQAELIVELDSSDEDEESVELSQEEIKEAEDDAAELVTMIVKTDDFDIPKDYHEFNERFPKYIENFLRRRGCPKELIPDFTQEMHVHLLTVSKRSLYKDRIHAFRPEMIRGYNAGHFFYYVNIVLIRKYVPLVNKRRKNPVTNAGTYSLDTYSGSSDSMGETDRNRDHIEIMCHEHAMISKHTRWSNSSPEDGMVKKQLAREFRLYVHKHRPDLDDMVKRFMIYDSTPDISRRTGIKCGEINKAKDTLRKLRQCFERGDLRPNV